MEGASDKYLGVIYYIDVCVLTLNLLLGKVINGLLEAFASPAISPSRVSLVRGLGGDCTICRNLRGKVLVECILPSAHQLHIGLSRCSLHFIHGLLEAVATPAFIT